MDTGIDVAEVGLLGALAWAEPVAAVIAVVIALVAAALSGRGQSRTRQGFHLVCVLVLRLIRAVEVRTRPDGAPEPDAGLESGEGEGSDAPE